MKKVVIGMSGGVDSSVAASILKDEYEVIGVTLRMQGDCFGLEDEQDAALVCRKLGIEHRIVDCSESFRKYVKDYFVSEYLKGRTPNPCIRCNRYVKCKALYDYAEETGADYYATGHYAFVDLLDNGRYALRSANSSKDQTYALYMLSQEQLSKLIMPLGHLSKEEVREKAHSIGLNTAEKPDSMEICFIPGNNHAEYIENYAGVHCPEGSFISPDGNVLGHHKGIINYTIGQRKGLGIAFGEPRYVTEINAGDNTVVLGTNEELFRHEVTFRDINFMGVSEDEVISSIDSKSFKGKIRYSHKGEKCSIISYADGVMKIRFNEKVRAVTPGQSVVIYDESGHVMCGGEIV